MSSNAPKIVVIGAGSATFGLGALSTIIQHEAMKGAELALKTLLLDPMVTDIDSGRAILDDLVAANAVYLLQIDNPPQSPQSIGGKLVAGD